MIKCPFARSFPFGMQSILRTPKPFCGRPKCPLQGLLAYSLFSWHAVVWLGLNWRRRLLLGRRCISWHWCAFVWQALHWVTWMVLSRSIQWEGRWKVTWFYLILISHPQRSPQQVLEPSLILFVLFAFTSFTPFLHRTKSFFFQKNGCGDENQTITVQQHLSNLDLPFLS